MDEYNYDLSEAPQPDEHALRTLEDFLQKRLEGNYSDQDFVSEMNELYKIGKF